MILSSRVRLNSLGFLLYLEWILLAIVIISETFPFWFFSLPRIPILNFFCITLFAVMGLKLPSDRAFYKLFYIGTEIILILLASILGGIRLFPLLYVIFVIRNCFIFEGRIRLLLTGLAFILFSLTQTYRMPNLTLAEPSFLLEQLKLIFFSVAILFGLLVLFLQLLVDAVLAEKKSREKLAIANMQLREYALRLEDVVSLQERNRIARELHDSLGHSLTAFNLHLEAALRLIKTEPTEAIELLTEAKQLSVNALKEVRESVAALRSDPLQGKSLSEAIDCLIRDWQRSTGIALKSTINLSYSISKDLKIAIYRIVQEALTNISKYAEATEVRIVIQINTKLELQIKDNGKGFNLKENTTGFGLQGMQERTRALGGIFQIITSPQKGCQILVNFPL